MRSGNRSSTEPESVRGKMAGRMFLVCAAYVLWACSCSNFCVLRSAICQLKILSVWPCGMYFSEIFFTTVTDAGLLGCQITVMTFQGRWWCHRLRLLQAFTHYICDNNAMLRVLTYKHSNVISSTVWKLHGSKEILLRNLHFIL